MTWLCPIVEHRRHEGPTANPTSVGGYHWMLRNCPFDKECISISARKKKEELVLKQKQNSKRNECKEAKSQWRINSKKAKTKQKERKKGNLLHSIRHTNVRTSHIPTFKHTHTRIHMHKFSQIFIRILVLTILVLF